MEVDCSLLLCSTTHAADLLCDATQKANTRGVTTSEQRAQKVDKDKRKVDIDDDVNGQERNSRVSLQSNAAASVFIR
jgi:hypothetical protein